MSNLFNATNTAMHKTQNGSHTHGSTLNACLDLFFVAGASRGKNIESQFAQAFCENPKTAMQILFWLRDVRGGAGERQQFRNLVAKVTTRENAYAVMQKTVELGRWDDLHVFLGTEFEDLAVSVTADALVQENSLAAKWTPRKGTMFNLLRKKMELTPKDLRHMLVRLSNTVEQKMSAGNWSEIDFSKLPSVASSRYMTAFHRNDAARYEAYKNALVKGETKINAGAVYPYDITKAIKHTGSSTLLAVAEQQWKALPNYMEGSDRRVLPVIDVSSSMHTCVGGNANLSCMDVAVSLGLYLSERNASVFKDQFITFHERPQMLKAEGSLRNRLDIVYPAPWGGSTNLDAVFDLILNAGVKHKLPQSDMPTDVIICSDMEFNSCHRGGTNKTAFDRIKQKYKNAGYEMPVLTFWRIDVKVDKNNPVQMHETGTKLVSGFSPSLLKTILTGNSTTPYETMLEVVDVPRYTI